MSAIVVGKELPYAISGASGGMSEDGTVTWQLKYMVSEDDLETYRKGNTYRGYPEISRTWEESNGCMGFELTITYRGNSSETEEGDFSLDVSFSEEPIMSHPRWDKIKKLYRATVNDEGEVSFQEYIRLTGRLNKLEGSKGFIKNPMFGVKTYLVFKAVVRHTYLSNSRPSLSMIGRITNTVPGGFATPENHDWLIMPPKSRRKGSKYENVIEYLLSPLGGWQPEVYELMEGRGLAGEEEAEDPFSYLRPREGSAGVPSDGVEVFGPPASLANNA